jgi:modification target Cys-rich repeat protein
MNKLRLELDDLRVDTFSTSEAAGGESGTVRAHGVGVGPSYDQPCEPVDMDHTVAACPVYTDVGTTCAASCHGSCYATCYGTCAHTCDTFWQQTCANATCDPCYPI